MTNGNNAAYPETRKVGNAYSAEGGMTKREYFAAMTLTSMKEAESGEALRLNAEWAVRQADALIAALNEPLTPATDAKTGNLQGRR